MTNIGIATVAAGGIVWLALAGVVLGGCESPASFKICLAQTQAEVDICGINMTCKCERQASVVRCYEKCGDDKYYRRLKLGEKGQQQIYCSQRRSDEPVDLPIIAADSGPAEPAKRKDEKPKSTPPPPPAAARSAERRSSRSDRDMATTLAADMDGAAAAAAAIRVHLLAALALAAAL
ncbi:hypothetical protein LPJ61_000323 [Coemansia biformis]|uniref:Extracellular membrane protein CFEM domain-containing protein n=1 Tax=Coemansia biformis TaxID=1286918 RepID=A0A9W7YBZ1_9FUNG|nr:hypothetical protein LPJ61_000323 [Coemansia biformis]